MPAPTHTPAAPAAPPTPQRPGRIKAELPWWALALPTAAFVVLLSLVLDPADAHAVSGRVPLLDVLVQLRQALPF
ncbi:hypothetical protein QIS99_14925 [Streptomyces sp. B-S-A8]|uniref:Uncharacterized protein n=1 Tax=Streptomyces solicavernae TaxID=3043614 RepID=A0ABT6RSS0_9ACTN|nr:hypothetical protein [Streptomyces sp. B-S-A8]MDI3387483.1 hypothetical protein [Streptomyces sp. B-S-A8]